VVVTSEHSAGPRASRRRHFVLVFLFFAACTTLYTFPLAFRPSSMLAGGFGDYLGEAAVLSWNAHQVVRDPLRLFDSPFYYPYSKTLAYGQSLFFPALVALPALKLVHDPLPVMNGLVLLTLTLSGLFVYALAHTLTGRAVPSLGAGVVFAYFPNRIDHLGQFTYQMTVLFPVAMWALYRFVLAGQWRHLLLLVGALWAQALSSLYNAYVLGLLLVAFLAALILLRPRAVLSRAAVAKGAVGLLLFALALAPFLAPYVALHREMGLERDVGEAEFYGMDLLSVLDAGAFNTFYGGRLVPLGRSEGGMFPGFVALVLAAAAVSSARRRGEDEAPRPSLVVWANWTLLALAVLSALVILLVPWLGGVNIRLGAHRLFHVRDLTVAVNVLPWLVLGCIGLEGTHRRAGPLGTREWTLVLLFLALLAYLLSLAPTIKIAEEPWGTSLFRWVYLNVPGGHAFRAPGRWSTVFFLPLALLAALGARAVGDAFGRRLGPAVAGLLLMALMLEYVDLPLPWTTGPPTPPVYSWLAAEPGEFTTLELPVYAGAPDAWYMYWATSHWTPTVNGAIGFVPPMIDEIVGAVRPFQPDAFMHVLRSVFPLRYLIVHTRLGPPSDRDTWARLRVTPPAGLRLVQRILDEDVYELDGTPETGIELRRYFSSGFARRHSEAQYDLALAGDDPEVTREVEIALNGRLLRRADVPGSGTVALGPSFKAADRNELRFRHLYHVRPEVVRTDAYRIGRTGVHAPVDLLVVSGGKFGGNTVSIRVNGYEAVTLPRRGYHVVALDPGDGRLVAAQHFDTFIAGPSRQMAALIDTLPPGTIVVAAVKHDGGGALTAEAVHALSSIGGRVDNRGTLWRSHLVIGVKGARPGEAIEAVGEQELGAAVGRDRALALTLKAFALR
jgi:hypothetical protein